MDGVGNQGLGFAICIADADIDGLGVGVAVLRGNGFVVDFAVVFILG